ncbi:hypothetical protein B0H65DRAFT_309143 [Neurospora tetraspora]|uniref:Cytochrome b561 domain-containing protein n=1 Tax=Neurospora tetraspora TaxID=94610 RepID=A0AAE0J6U9_9PEZI|nr:hypothetical protein B0H65DRAFT_309143 [Neurospora tetraspora]
MLTTGGERPLVPMALLSAAKLAALIGIFCSVVAVEGRPDVHNHFDFPGSGQGAPVAQGVPDDVRDWRPYQRYYLHIHGIIAALAFVILFPLGSILIRLLPRRMALFAHATWQLFTLLVYMAAVGIGIHLIKLRPDMMRFGRMNYHPIIGIFVLALLFIQPLVGIFHHKEYKVNRRRGLWSALHLTIGRIAITVGIINGYLGLIAADDTRTKVKAIYVAVALALWILWTAMSMWWEWKRHRRERSEKELERALAEDRTGVGANRGINGIGNRRPVNDQSDTRAREALRKAKRSRV